MTPEAEIRLGMDISYIRLNNAGLGAYVRELKTALENINKSIDITFFEVGQDRDNLLQKKIQTRFNTLYRDLIWLNFILPFQAKRRKIEVLHMPVFYAPLIKPCHIVLTIHDMIWFDHPEYFPVWQRHFMKAFVPLAVKRSDAIIAVSTSTKNDIVEKLGISPNKIHVTHLGISDQFRIIEKSEVQKVKSKYNIDKYILVVGSVEPRKNLKRILEAFLQINRNNPDVFLVHVGSGMWKSESVFKDIERLGLVDSIRFLWNLPQKDLAALYNGALFLAFPSLYEGFGLPVIEAMACGCPVITSNISSLPEVSGDAALLVDPYDISQIAQAMKSFLCDSSFRKEYSEKGIARAREFSWEKCARLTLEIYQKVNAK